MLRAMTKPTGHLNLLDLDIRNCDAQDFRVKKLLDYFKNNISALDLPYWKVLDSDWVSFLQHENTRFPFLEKLTIDKEILIEDNLLKKHAEQLTYLDLMITFEHPNIPVFLPPHFPKFSKLETLIVYYIHPDVLVSLLSLCSESLSTLRIYRMSEEEPNIPLQQLPELPKLQTLEIRFCELGETVKSLISKCRQTLTGISFDNMFDFEMEDTYFPKLKYLKFIDIPNVDVIQDKISANACQLETLILCRIDNLILPNPLSNIKNLFINDCENLANILNCASLLQCLMLDGYQDSDLEDLKDVKKIPNLTDFYLLDIYVGNWFTLKEITDLLVKKADTLEFFVLEHRKNSYTEFETMVSIPVELKKVHTLILFLEIPLLESEREFYKSLCPNAQIMINNGNGGEYILETVKSRLKYHKADDLFCQEINESINRKLKIRSYYK